MTDFLLNLIRTQLKNNNMGLRKKKGSEKVTLKRVRIGNFEVRVSESKVEIEDVVNNLSKHVYNILSFEGSVISHMLSPLAKDDETGKYRTKTDEEIETGIKNVDLLLVALIYTNLIFSNADFRADYFKLVDKTINQKSANKISKKEDDEILEELKTEHEMKETNKL